MQPTLPIWQARVSYERFHGHLRGRDQISPSESSLSGRPASARCADTGQACPRACASRTPGKCTLAREAYARQPWTRGVTAGPACGLHQTLKVWPAPCEGCTPRKGQHASLEARHAWRPATQRGRITGCPGKLAHAARRLASRLGRLWGEPDINDCGQCQGHKPDAQVAGRGKGRGGRGEVGSQQARTGIFMQLKRRAWSHEKKPHCWHLPAVPCHRCAAGLTQADETGP